MEEAGRQNEEFTTHSTGIYIFLKSNLYVYIFCNMFVIVDYLSEIYFLLPFNLFHR